MNELDAEREMVNAEMGEHTRPRVFRATPSSVGFGGRRTVESNTSGFVARSLCRAEHRPLHPSAVAHPITNRIAPNPDKALPVNNANK
jgi:hypothetical protein